MRTDHTKEVVDKILVPEFLELGGVPHEVGQQLPIEYDRDNFWCFASILFPLDKLQGGQGSRFHLSTASNVLNQ